MPDAPVNLSTQEKDGGLRVRLSGRLLQATAGKVWRQAEACADLRPEVPLILDLSGLIESDSTGAALVVRLRSLCQDQGRPFVATGLSRSLNQLLKLVEVQDLSTPEWPVTCPSFFECVGDHALQFFRDTRSIFSFIGEISLSFLHALRHPARVRWRETLYYMDRTGADALPIMGLISFLVGLILAFLGYQQLHKLGADMYVADGVAYGMARLFAPLMVAIVCAGRSGSAFASEIGTMKVSEELDALDVMGLDRARFLMVPKVLALVLMMPFLVVYSNLLGMAGGFFVAVTSLKITYGTTYIQRSIQVLTIWTVASGLVKTLVFAVVIGAVGCLRGLQTKQGPQAVGEVTTSAVVSGLLLIVIVEGVFSVVYHYLDL